MMRRACGSFSPSFSAGKDMSWRRLQMLNPALAQLAEHSFDLIHIRCEMPGLDGIALLDG